MSLKCLYYFVLLVFSFKLWGFRCNAQSKEFLESFEVSQIKGKVFLTWTIRAGNICVGVEVLRSVNSVDFEFIGGVEGVCGNLSFASNYSFTDHSPVKNQVNYYKLNLGGEGFSEIRSIEIFDTSENGYLIIPHPISDLSKIRFSNDAGLLTTLRVYSLGGNLVLLEHTQLNYFEISNTRLEKGHYLFQLSSEVESEPIIGKMIVL